MNSSLIKCLKLARNAQLKFLGNVREFMNKKTFYNTTPIAKGQDANTIIANALKSNKLFMLTRIGGSEMSLMQTYLQKQKKGIAKYLEFINGGRYFFLHEDLYNAFFYHCGIFPATEQIFLRVAPFYLSQLKYIDILGTWLNGEEELFNKFFPQAKLCSLYALDSFLHENPWSQHLAGKKVLVIHPFEKTIKSQYEKRELLFEDKNVLPAFELKTIKAVQSLYQAKVNADFPFRDWFEALDSMFKQIDNTDFDIAIIGAGAYGLPLASYIKQKGKSAIHLGGTTQLLFGIKGHRWEVEQNGLYTKYFNEHWVRPADEDKVSNYKELESGAYW